MCLIAVHKPEAALSYTQARTVAQHNPHGIGAVYLSRADGAVRHVASVPTSTDECVETYAAIVDDALPGAEMVVHWRYRTHGPVNVDMCHPFAVPGRKGMYFAHNGVISGYGTADMSDTAHYVATRLPRATLADIEKETAGSRCALVSAKVGALTARRTGKWDKVGDVHVSNTYSLETYSAWGAWGAGEDTAASDLVWAIEYLDAQARIKIEDLDFCAEKCADRKMAEDVLWRIFGDKVVF